MRRPVDAGALGGAPAATALLAVLLVAGAPGRASAQDSRGGTTFGGLLISGFRAEPGESRRESAFELFEARLRASGTAGVGLEYELRAGLDEERREVELLDARITLPLRPQARISAGQFKAPFGRELLQDRAQIQLLNRSQATEALAPARQVGVQVAGDLLGRRLSYRTGLFNGEGRGVGNPDGAFLYAARLEFSRVGGEMEFYDELALRVGASFALSEDSAADFRTAGRLPASPAQLREFSGERLAWGADLHFAYRGVFANAEYLGARFEPDPAVGPGSPTSAGGGPGSADASVRPGAAEDPAGTAWGVAAEGGYKLWGGLLDLLARYDGFEPAGGAAPREFLVLGANLYPGLDARLGLQYAVRLDGDGAARPLPEPGPAPGGGFRVPGGLSDGQFVARLRLSF